MSDSCKDACRATDKVDRRTLRKVLAINASQALGGGLVGIWASSTALMGAALDNVADAGVYGLSLYAVGRKPSLKARAARLSGWLLITLSAALLVEVIRRLLRGSEPIGPAMMGMAAINAACNLLCLRLLRRHRDQDVNFRASWIFTSNDALVNAGIVLSGTLVSLTGSQIPDLVIGLLVVAIAFHGGREILQEAHKQV